MGLSLVQLLNSPVRCFVLGIALHPCILIDVNTADSRKETCNSSHSWRYRCRSDFILVKVVRSAADFYILFEY